MKQQICTNGMSLETVNKIKLQSVSKELIAKATRLNELKTTRLENSKEEEKLKEFFKALLNDINQNSYNIGNFLITNTPKTTRPLDQKKVKQFLGDKLPEFLRENKTKVFNIVPITE